MSFFKRIILGAASKVAGDAGKTATPQLSVVESAPRATRIWAVGGGKGGVGKSLISSNLGVMLARTGKRALLVDADLGAANLHTFLGVENSRSVLSNFLKSEETDIRPYITRTDIPRLDLVSGAKDSLSVADQSPASISRLKEALLRADYDYIIMDIGPGTSANNLDLFLFADEGVLVTTPEPTSIENTYRFLKCIFLRRIKNICHSRQDSGLKNMLNQVFDGHWKSQIKTVSDILLRLKELDPKEGAMLGELMANSNVSLIVNQAKRPSDSAIGPSMSRACYDYFGVKIGFLGEISYGEDVTESVRSKKPLVVSYSESPAAKAVSVCFDKLIDGEKRLKKAKAF